MQSNKAGLADLKRLHQTALEEQRARTMREQAAQKARPSPQAKGPASVASDEEIKLFARATQSVTPIKAAARAVHRPSEHARAEVMAQRRLRALGQEPTTAPALSDTFSPFSAEDADLAWLAPGIGPEVLRQLRRAFWPVGAHLDLHGMNSDAAKIALAQFIETSKTHGTRCVRIVHGQGYGSTDGQSVLKSRVAQWLTQLSTISAFASAPQAHGGRGALLALLRL
ncbi:Smr/MutS family protein [Zwartia sp.]|uniref:Smr/MutS family protein n=1 Tax=Zwartia sp. TaxID=2978004 RepID=UPI00271EC8B2|nr:Smr/MutS family protein [Zwartia sp.]MDO9023824.1 Smr/MutS family protein [Zwartia sp.]